MRAPRLIVTADDFGQTTEVNAAVTRAHEEGILTCASLMVRGAAAAEAIALARRLPRLGVGLHLTLVQGTSVCPAQKIPGLVDDHGRFPSDPVAAGWRYWWRRDLRESLRREIAAQFEAFTATGLPMDHVNGHLHFHLHPSLVSWSLDQAAARGVRGARLTRDPWRWNLRLAQGRWLYRLSHALLFEWLAGRSKAEWRRRGLRHTDAVFGLLQHGRVDETFLLKLVASLPGGDFELYSHPCSGAFDHELKALVSARVRRAVEKRGVVLIRYADL